MYIRIMKTGVLFVAVCFIFAVFSDSYLFAQGNDRIVVQKIEQKELDKLMKSRESRSLVVAMASWCGPCRDELPLLVRMNNKYKDKGLRIIGISVDVDGTEAMQKIADRMKVNFPIYWAGEEAAEKYGIYAVPMLYLIKNGKVIDKVPGQQSEASLEKKIGGLLK
ncbi:MAG: TlpA disulfide reductase family protein [Desulfobacterales bacterium]|nr:TlpA disulfide reductase family protein [Desulfobacterales bacterium]